MPKFLKLLLPTLVLTSGFSRNAAALPTDPSPDFTATGAVSQPKDQSSENKRDLISITPAPGATHALQQERASLEYFYKYRHELNVQFGGLYDTEGRGSEDHIHKTISVRYLYPDHKLQAWEWNGTFISDSTGTASFSRRLIYSQERFRPYNSLGVGLHIFPDQALANFLLWRQYQLRAATGFEWTTNISGHELNWRLEAALALSVRSQQADFSIGYVWPW